MCSQYPQWKIYQMRYHQRVSTSLDFGRKKTSSIISKQLNNSKFTFENKQQQEFSQNLKITFQSSEIPWWVRLYESAKMLSIRNLCWKPIVSGCTKSCIILIWIFSYKSYLYLQWKSRWIYIWNRMF